MNQTETLTRKEIASLTKLPITEKVIHYREKELGLDKCRITFLKMRPILYNRNAVLERIKQWESIVVSGKK